MKDEIKEIKIPNNVLATLGDLTNGALNYYKAPKTIELKYKLLLDYITNLQEKVKLLTTGLEATDKAYKTYKSRNEKAIEYIKEDIYVEPKELYGLIDGEHLLNILKGVNHE